MLVRSKQFPQLLGEFKETQFYNVKWQKPWLAFSLLKEPFFLSSSDYEALEEAEENSLRIKQGLKNIPCLFCKGRGVTRVTSRTEMIYNGPFKECSHCKGSGVFTERRLS